MDLITELNQAIEYIEDNLDGELELEEIAKITSYSPYHFQRIFNYITGIPLSEYIRKRRLSMAVFDLQNDEKVIDVALKYGYLSSDSFTRAFVKQHGITPSQIKSESACMELFPPLSFQLKVQGAKGLYCRIERREAFNMFGMSTKVSTKEAVIRSEMKQFLHKGKQNHWYEAMNTIIGYDPDMMLHGAFLNQEEDQVTYMVCQYMKDGIYVPDDYKRIHIPSGLWAVFHSDEEDLFDLWPRIYSEWLPNAEYEIIKEPAFEWYFGNSKKGNVRGEIMLPIKKVERNVQRVGQKRQTNRTKEVEDMNSRCRVIDFIYEDKWNVPLWNLYQAVIEKYPNGIYWSYDPNCNEGKHVFLCLDENNHVIGKGHAMIYEKQEDDAPGYAEHRIFIHYRVLPQYETKEVLDLLYDRVFECAKELRKQLSNRVCQLCFGNYDKEEVYNRHIESKGWPEHGSIYHLIANTKKTDPMLEEIHGIVLHEFSLDSMDIILQLVKNDQICFRESIASVENYLDTANGNYYAYGSFAKDIDGKEKLVGSVVVEMEEGGIPEIVGVMVLPEYRRVHLASKMIQHVLTKLNSKGYEKVWLVTGCENYEAIALYQKSGFSITAHEKRYMKYL